MQLSGPFAGLIAYSGDLDRLFRLKVTRHSAGSAL